MDLTGYFIHAPLSALYTLLLVISMGIVFDTAGKTIFRYTEPWARASYFFSGLLLTSWLILLLSLFTLVSVILLKLVALSFVLSAMILQLKNKSRFFFGAILKSLSIPPGASMFSRVTMYLVYVVLACSVIISLAPPTDADSLNYHLGIPVEILRSGSIWYNPDLLQYRMVGLGEMLNILGVANGCVQLGALLQWMGFLWLMYVYAETVPAGTKSTVLSLMLAAPVLLFLIPGQKHQLTGIVCTSLCFHALVHNRSLLQGRMLPLFTFCLVLAMGIKYSFLLSGFVIIVLLWAGAQGLKLAASKTLHIVLLGCIFLLPLFLYRYLHYGDILSPMLERYKSIPDEVVIKFAAYIKGYTDSGFAFPLNVLLPSSASNISSVLAWTAVMIIVFLFLKKYRIEAAVICLFIILTIFLGQQSSRFFLEPYFWMLPLLIVAIGEHSKWSIVLRIGQAQFLLLVPFFLYAVYILVPGIISDTGRETVLRQHAHEYNEAKWINAIVPGNAVVATFTPSRAFIDKRTFPLEYLSLIFEKDTASVHKIDKMLRDYNVQYLVVNPQQANRLRPEYHAEKVSGIQTFEKASRNPFNIHTYRLALYRLHLED